MICPTLYICMFNIYIYMSNMDIYNVEQVCIKWEKISRLIFRGKGYGV
jgi:hypothetical protein